MTEVIREGSVRVGVDLAKRVIQVHAVDAHERVVTSKALRREQFLAWCARLPEGSLVVMEASSSAHHWCRRLIAMGLDARIITAQLAAPYRQEGRSGKNDANDAAAICEAGGRPRMRFVPVKSVQQQSMLCVHKLREGFKEERTACINRIRGLLAEFGLVFAQSPDALRTALPEALEDASNELGPLARIALDRAVLHWRELDEHLACCDQRIAQHHRDDVDVHRAAQLIGVGPVTASVGLVPRQRSSGGKNHLGGITKHGQTYLRTLLIQAAKSAVMTAHRRNDPISRWVLALRERSGWQKAVVALANKNARILWAVMTRGEQFDASHVSIKPA
ncbi:IS110 family RNA-guided transposase [Piscinibacter terrae]|uniref:IS110 family transposase n=1 Tax=Piscinibacter terrae TaxID=2496871 RepID=A0A3N7HHD6_9BURK|nr:IS110 family transposase [Albitalea terrae]RQP21440.1 IS110 family transposase [Albitalea terrae]